MDEPPLEAPDESLNHENTDQTPDKQKTNKEGAEQVLHKGSQHAGVGSSEPNGDKVSGQATNTGYRQANRRTSEEAEQRSSQPTEHRLPSLAERRTSQQAERRLSERRTSQPPNQQLPSLSEGKASEKINGQVPLPSGRKAGQAHRRSLEHDDLISSDETDYSSGQSQVHNQADYWSEDPSDPHRLSEEIERDSTQVRQTEKQAGYRTYYKTLARVESRSLTNIHEAREAGQRVQPCTFEDSETDIRSKVSTETGSVTTVQAYTPHDTEITTDTQSSRDKLPSITTKVYYSSSPEKIQTTELTTVGKRDVLGGWKPR